LLLLLGGATAYVLWKELRGQPVLAILANADVRWLIPCVLAMLVFLFAESLNIRRGLCLLGYRPTLIESLRYGLAGFFFSSVTPSASGGQPAQLYFMSRDNVNLSHGSFALVAQLISFQIGEVSWGLIGLAFCLTGGFIPSSSGMILLFSVGFLLNLTSLTVLLLLMFSPKANGLIERFLVFCSRKILKKPGVEDSVHASMEEYRYAAELLSKNPRIFVRLVLTSFVQLGVYHSIPFFAARSLGFSSIPWERAVTMQGFLFLSVSSLPLPGASGATEGGFAFLFGQFLPSAELGSLLILSRFFSFILPLSAEGLTLLLLRFLSPQGAKKDRFPVT